MNVTYSGKSVKTVSELTNDLQRLIENNFRFVRVVGEVSNYRRPMSGHHYFVLKDDISQIRVVLFKNQARYLSQELKDGQQVICDGRVAVYTPRGEYQIIVDTLEMQGAGLLQFKFEQLKNRLSAEGLFDESKKTPLPGHIHKIIIITSPTGAAIHDFLSVCRKRRADLDIQILPARVQGDGASQNIASCVETADKIAPDVIVLCRGGGSIEDLWAFNEEDVVRAIFNATTPIVTGIGHEIDFTLADFSADKRCATPTAVAEFLAEDSKELELMVKQYSTRIKRAVSWQLDSAQLKLDKICYPLTTFDRFFHTKTINLDRVYSRLLNRFLLFLEQKQVRCSSSLAKIEKFSPASALNLHEIRLHSAIGRMKQAIRHKLEKDTMKFQEIVSVLESVSPLATLARGYAIASKYNPQRDKVEIITDSKQVEPEDKIGVKLFKGEIECIVRKKSAL